MDCSIAEGARLLSRAFSSSRAGSPLLFGLAPRGVFRASDVAIGAVGSYPTFSPLPNWASISKTSRRFSCAMPPCFSRPAVYSLWHFPWTVAQTEVCTTAPLALPGALPYFVTGSCEPTTTVSGLSSRPAILRWPSQRSPGSPANLNY